MADLDALLQLYGTTEPPPTSRRLVAGPLSLEISNGAMRSLCWNAIEILRTLDYPVRNADWGTISAVTVSEEFAESPTSFEYGRRFTVGGCLLTGSFTCSGNASGLVTATLNLRAESATGLNRAGFVILHPAGVAGSLLRVTHRDGTGEEREFPLLIAPSQPASDIVALRQEANGVVVDIAFAGETFEMEDQRNWSDASYKTYCRPLALPYPFQMAADETVEQSITLRVSGAGGAQKPIATQAIIVGSDTGRKLPQLALALEAGWEPDPESRQFVKAKSTLLRADLTRANWQQTLDRLIAASVGALDLELIVSDSLPELDTQLKALAATGIIANSIVVLPKAWLKSYQRSAAWPAGASPIQAAAVARDRFPESEIGSGVLTNFTELNRYREAARAGDFITHGTTAVVHDADDISVMQTLEALPQIFASAEALAEGKPYRLGLVSIGMRSNPYGADVAANPEGVRRPMAMTDPRQRGLFGAAWMVGAMAATEGAGVERLALAALGGPFGLFDGPRVLPAYHIHEALVCMGARQRLAVSSPPGIAAVAVDGALVIANLGRGTRILSLPQPGRGVVLDRLQTSRDWLRTESREQVTVVNLPAFSVAFVDTGPSDVFGSTL